VRRFSICEPILQGKDLREDVAIALEAGVGTIGLSFLSVGDADPADVRSVLDANGMSVSSYMALFDIGRHPAESEMTIERAATMGAERLLVCAGPLGDRTIDEADAGCRTWLEKMAPVCGDAGMQIVFEPLHPVRRQYTYVHTIAHALRIVGDIDNVGLVVDTGHLYWDPDLVEQFRANVDSVGLVQFTNVDSAGIEESKLLRAGLRDGDVPIGDLLLAFDAAGYTGVYEFEGMIPATGEDRAALARDAREWFEALFAG
jgi:sugar phosphate isomerase/epimerase